ncbi:hypothetical protein GN956_G14215 [Arapaima gigas]
MVNTFHVGLNQKASEIKTGPDLDFMLTQFTEATGGGVKAGDPQFGILFTNGPTVKDKYNEMEVLLIHGVAVCPIQLPTGATEDENLQGNQPKSRDLSRRLRCAGVERVKSQNICWKGAAEDENFQGNQPKFLDLSRRLRCAEELRARHPSITADPWKLCVNRTEMRLKVQS